MSHTGWWRIICVVKRGQMRHLVFTVAHKATGFQRSAQGGKTCPLTKRRLRAFPTFYQYFSVTVMNHLSNTGIFFKVLIWR